MKKSFDDVTVTAKHQIFITHRDKYLHAVSDCPAATYFRKLHGWEQIIWLDVFYKDNDILVDRVSAVKSAILLEEFYRNFTESEFLFIFGKVDGAFLWNRLIDVDGDWIEFYPGLEDFHKKVFVTVNKRITHV